MRIPFPSLGKWLVLGGILAALALLWIPATQRIHWVGGTDLEIKFTVSDLVTGHPIKGAEIKVKSEGGFCTDDQKEQFSLVTHDDGTVTRLCKQCMSFGTSGWNIDTYCVHLPWWFYKVSAQGYSPSDLFELDVPENMRRVQRGNPAATLVVQIRLEK